MAEFSHSKVLFTNNDGSPMLFYMPPCSERHRLKPYIEHGGGILSNRGKFKEDVINLAVPGNKSSLPDAFKPSYVLDSVEQNKRLSLHKYRLMEGAVCPSDTDGDFDKDLTAMASNVIRGQPKDVCGRRKFLLAEDRAIIRYLLNENLYNDVKGNQMWKTMQVLEITNHTWQSMKDRYIKTILPRIHQYPLKPQEQALLAGELSEQTRRKVISEVHDNQKSPAKTASSPRKLSPQATTNQRHSSGTGYDIAEDDVSTETDDELDDLDNDLVKVASKSKSSRNDLMTGVNNVSNKKAGSPRIRELLRKRKSPRKPESPGKPESPRKRLTPRKHEDNVKSPIQEDEDSPQLQPEPGTTDSHKITTRSGSSVQASMDTSDSPVLQMASQGGQDDTAKGDTDSIRRRTRSSQHMVSMETDATKPSEVTADEATGEHVTSTSRSRIRKSRDSDVKSSASNRANWDSDVKSPASKRVSRHRGAMVDCDSSIDSESMSTSYENCWQDIEVVGEASTSNIQQTKRHTHLQNESPNKKHHSRKQVMAVLEKIERWLGLTRPEMLECLYRANGRVDDAVCWIIDGVTQNGRPVWNKVADKLVNELMTETSGSLARKRLLKTYTEAEIDKRLEFLRHIGQLPCYSPDVC